MAKEAATDHRLAAILAEDRAWFHPMLGLIVQGAEALVHARKLDASVIELLRSAV